MLLKLDDSDELGTLRSYDTRLARLQTQLNDLQRAVSGKQIAWTAGVALAVVVAFNHFTNGGTIKRGN